MTNSSSTTIAVSRYFAKRFHSPVHVSADETPTFINSMWIVVYNLLKILDVDSAGQDKPYLFQPLPSTLTAVCLTALLAFRRPSSLLAIFLRTSLDTMLMIWNGVKRKSNLVLIFLVGWLRPCGFLWKFMAVGSGTLARLEISLFKLSPSSELLWKR